VNEDDILVMKNSKTPLYSQIRMLLTQLLRDGLPVSADTLFFAESTYGITEETFEAAITDRCFEERQIVINMLFFPTQKMREQLEPFLATGPFSEEKMHYLAQEIACDISEVCIRLPSLSSFSWAVSHEAIDHFINKLYMTRALDPAITAALDDKLPEEIATRLKVSMRCRNIGFSEEARRFLLTFVDKGAHRGEAFQGMAELLMTLTTGIPPQMTITEYLFEQREYQKKRLSDIEEFAKKTEQYGMEYLMMQNYPVPHESEEKVSQLLQMYTIIIEEVLHLQNPKENYINRRELGNFDSENDLQRLFKSLS
jgi:hypothetical protein